MNQYEKRNTINIGQSSPYSNVTDPLIIPLIFIFLSCHEKAQDNRKFSNKNLRPCCESHITTH